MTYSVTQLADHKGFSAPKVSGDEYVVNVELDVTSFAATAISVTGDFLALPNQFTADAGEDISSLEVGQAVTLTDCADSGNNATVTIEAIDGQVITFSNVAADEASDTITITDTHEKITASSLGLSTISAVEIIGQESLANGFQVIKYLSDTTFELKAFTLSNGTVLATTTDAGTVRLRVYGNI